MYGAPWKLKSFAKLGKSPSRTLDIYDYNWDGAYCVMDEKIVCNSWNDPLQDHRNIWLCRRRCLHDQIRRYFKLFAKVRMSHSRTIKIYDCSWGGAWILMDDTIWNRLQQYAWPTPGPSESMTIAETVLSLSWTMLFEIVCKCTHYPPQDHQNLWLQLGWC